MNCVRHTDLGQGFSGLRQNAVAKPHIIDYYKVTFSSAELAGSVVLSSIMWVSFILFQFDI